MEETNRQKKVSKVLQIDIANYLQEVLRNAAQKGIIISVSDVKVTVDFTEAKVYLSIFPSDNAPAILEEVNAIKHRIKHHVAQLTRHQIRKMPELTFFIDDRQERADAITRALKGEDNPLKDNK
ncbi:MAG TPA: ribosome-binding factor A [Flavobacteriaceae bacterium]|nr:ribosome-binding factor A [Flavobacteriaceae bacterium]